MAKKFYNTTGYEFCCNGCGKIAGRNKDEGKARQQARETARLQNWKWEHPGWGLRCPDCHAVRLAIGKAIADHMK